MKADGTDKTIFFQSFQMPPKERCDGQTINDVWMKSRLAEEGLVDSSLPTVLFITFRFDVMCSVITEDQD